MVAYLLACFVMGLGIAIDVAIASIALGSQLRSAGAMRRWVSRITATHIGFPMFGYYGALHLERFAAIRPLLGAAAFLMIAFFLYRMLRSLISDEAAAGAADTAIEPGWALVLAVSWDALWSGPAKAAQAVGWTPDQVIFSFPLAGLVVALSAILSTLLAHRLRDRARSRASSALSQARFERRAIMIEVGVFSYFAYLALLTFSADVERPFPPAAGAALVTMILVHLAVGRRIEAAVLRLRGGA